MVVELDPIAAVGAVDQGVSQGLGEQGPYPGDVHLERSPGGGSRFVPDTGDEGGRGDGPSRVEQQGREQRSTTFSAQAQRGTVDMQTEPPEQPDVEALAGGLGGSVVGHLAPCPRRAEQRHRVLLP